MGANVCRYSITVSLYNDYGMLSMYLCNWLCVIRYIAVVAEVPPRKLFFSMGKFL